MLRRLGLGLGLLVAALPSAVSAEDRPLRLVTFNVLHGGPWSGVTGNDRHLERRLSMIVEGLRALDPDVVALQESAITRRHGDVAGRIAQALGLHHVHARATERVFPLRLLGRLIVGVLGFVEGPAILSRFPITASEVYDLPRCRRRLDPRVVLRADLDTPAGALSVFSTHTSRDDCQTRRVAELAREHQGAAPAVVMGDLNTGEAAPGLAGFRDQGFVDVFRAANPTAPGLTVWQRIEEPVPTVFRRVDYVFLRAGEEVAASALSGRVVLDTPQPAADGGVLWPSDHYGVFVEVGLLRRTSAR
jgi:endonuclease/exonuclease/phosphatase family metal-dependent hydrolase